MCLADQEAENRGVDQATGRGRAPVLHLATGRGRAPVLHLAPRESIIVAVDGFKREKEKPTGRKIPLTSGLTTLAHATIKAAVTETRA